MRYIDLSGKVFGRLTVIERTARHNPKKTAYLCKCQCGKEKIVTSDHLTSSHTKSCGCLKSPLENEVHEKLRAKIKKYTKINKKTGCWEWQRYLSKGYGMMIYKGRATGMHRISWIVFKNENPGELFVLHKCDNRKCINPDHLFLGTQKDNIKDMYNKGRNKCNATYGNTKLTEEQVLEIRKIDKKLHTCIEIGKKYGVNATAINKIQRRKTWKHIPQEAR